MLNTKEISFEAAQEHVSDCASGKYYREHTHKIIVGFAGLDHNSEKGKQLGELIQLAMKLAYADGVNKALDEVAKHAKRYSTRECLRDEYTGQVDLP